LDRVTVAQIRPAVEDAMAAQLAALDAIARDPDPPSLENTLEAIEGSGRALDRATTIYGIWSSALSTPDFQAVERELAPRLAAHQDRITQNEPLFARIAQVYGARSGLAPEPRRLAWYYFTNFVRAGAKLSGAGRERVAAINETLAALYTEFTQHVLADEDAFTLIEHEDDLSGLSASLRTAAAETAAAHGRPGRWAILNTRSCVEPFLASADRRQLRESVWRAFVTRGDHGDANDNKAVITEILKLRAERAKLLGYPTHAHWRLEDSMARTPERAMALLSDVWPAAVARAREEVAEMQALADQEGAGHRIEAWDYRYYAEKVRRARYAFDQEELTPYLQLEKIREAMFWVAERLFDLRFRPVTDVPVYHPDVRVWAVADGAGRHVGLWYFDPWARAGKHSGAWMNAYRNQERFDGEVTTLVSNNANFLKARPGEPVLVSWDDATTLFHEFGHALHGLSSAVAYPSLSGTNVPRDYVEFPSQLLERWLATPEVLERFARHVETGRALPLDLVEKVHHAQRFNQGFKTVEYLAAAFIDMRAHLAGEQPVEPAAFERDTLAELGMPPEISMRHRMPHFSHVFAGDGYSAGYYSYLWADTLSADAYEAFTEASGPYDLAVVRRLRQCVLSVGNTVDPAEGYRAFRGRDAGIEALMRQRGFPIPGSG
jgi:peptidyl-dipeptidase Dcp